MKCGNKKSKIPSQTSQDGSDSDYSDNVRSSEVHYEDDPDEIQDDIHVTPKKKRKRLYRQSHRKEWESKFNWVTASKEKNCSFCKVCDKPLASKLALLTRHEGTDHHKKNLEMRSKTFTLDDYLAGDFLTREKHIKKSEFKCVMFLHGHNLPLILMDHLPKFLTSVCPDSEIAKEIKCSRTEATKITNNNLAVENKRLIKEDLNNNFYSVIIDETTDLPTEKSLVVLIRFWSNDSFAFKDRFLGLVKLLECDAKAICKTTLDLLAENGIDTANLIGFAADNASVMMGNKEGVQAKLKKINPFVFVLGCTCHSFNLCCNAAVSKIPKSVEKLAKSVFNHFSNTSNRTESLKEFQSFVNLKPCKMLRPSQTRWLSLQVNIFFYFY